MSYQKIKPCPLCKSEHVGVYKYDSGWQYVECDGAGCWYRGPGEGSISAAIKSHNAKASEIPPAERQSPEGADIETEHFHYDAATRALTEK